MSLVPLALGTVQLMALYLVLRTIVSTDHDVAVLNAATIAAAFAMNAVHFVVDVRRRGRLRIRPRPVHPHPPPQHRSPSATQYAAQVESAVQAGRYYDYILLHDPEARQRALNHWDELFGAGERSRAVAGNAEEEAGSGE